ncbi:hydrogenase expression/formation protein HypE [Candidatus Bathyarchaeota archaeon]|nr:hydrogenase expression/formation protein HypE [Candidatus Bathyarchaeota archaeon]
MVKDVIELIHGGGGTIMEQLIRSIIVSGVSIRKALNGVGLDELDDGASMKLGDYEIVVSMDGHTVDPIFFPGGDIGRLAVSGTLNDVAMMGARPIALCDSIIVEEGFPISDLRCIVTSMNETAKEIGVAIVGGDFKVMPKGRLDRIVITTCGLGLAKKGQLVMDNGAKPGDKVIVTGSIGDHGIALLAAREGLGFETELKSDVAPIWETINAALRVGGVTAMKDPTRGGLASALNEIAAKSKVSIWLQEELISIKESVKAASEMLGLDPLEVTCEGVATICVSQQQAEEVLEAIRKTRYGKDAQIIGTVKAEKPGYVLLETVVGGTRVVEKPLGEPIPRVC